MTSLVYRWKLLHNIGEGHLHNSKQRCNIFTAQLCEHTNSAWNPLFTPQKLTAALYNKNLKIRKRWKKNMKSWQRQHCSKAIHTDLLKSWFLDDIFRSNLDLGGLCRIGVASETPGFQVYWGQELWTIWNISDYLGISFPVSLWRGQSQEPLRVRRVWTQVWFGVTTELKMTEWKTV